MPTIFFDILIFGFVLFNCGLILFILIKKPKNIPATMQKIMIGILTVLGLIIIYGSFIAPRFIDVKKEIIRFPRKENKQITLLHISDMHIGPYKGARYVQKIINHILEIAPDYVVITGDFVLSDGDVAQKMEAFDNISLVYDIYAVTGNHEYDMGSFDDPIDLKKADKIKTALEKLGIKVLNNRGVLIDENIWLAGIEDIWSGQADLQSSLEGRPQGSPTILLAHNPDTVMQITAEHQIDLTLSGHTHGGQIRLPLIGAIGHIPNTLGKKFDQGYYELETTDLSITSGIGESGPRARLFNPPEMILYTITY